MFAQTLQQSRGFGSEFRFPAGGVAGGGSGGTVAPAAPQPFGVFPAAAQPPQQPSFAQPGNDDDLYN